MATTVAARRPRRRRAAKSASASPTRRRRRVHASTTVAAPRKRRRAKPAAAPARRRRARKSPKVQARRRRRPAMVMAARKRPVRRRRRRVEAWRGDSAGHRKAAHKGHRRRKARQATRRHVTRETVHASRPRRRARRMREPSVVQARRRRRRSVSEAPRRTRRRHYARAAGSASHGMEVAELAIAVVSGGLGFVAADALDRFLATYDPSAATLPTDRFTSNGAGTLANTLNVASPPDWKRVAAVIGIAAVPAIASVYVEQPFVRSALEGFTVGAGVKAFQLLWNNVLMPLLKPATTDNASLQKSMIARLYPAEVAASINLAAKTTTGAAFTGLSQPPAGYQPQAGVGSPDVGPFALSGSSPYPDAAQALRRQAGMGGDSQYPDAAQALRQQAGVHGPGTQTQHPTLQQVNGGPDNRASGLSQPPAYQPGPGTSPGPGPQPEGAACSSCLGDNNQFLGFIGDAEDDRPMPIVGNKAA